MTKALVRIDIVSDVVCPWCYVGKRQLERAVAADPAQPVEIHWRPDPHDPTIPPGGMDRKLYLERKFGGGDNIARLQAPIKAVGEVENIPFAFEAIRRSPNTLDAHRLLRWAEMEERQDALVERLFRLYFVEGADLGDHAVLAEAAASAGMDRQGVLARLASDADRAEVEREIARAREIGVTGVPTFIVGNRYAVVGAREPEVIAGAIARVAEELRRSDQG
jgi:predicted DsbA family dithiol-disulfide isomerase